MLQNEEVHITPQGCDIQKLLHSDISKPTLVKNVNELPAEANSCIVTSGKVLNALSCFFQLSFVNVHYQCQQQCPTSA